MHDTTTHPATPCEFTLAAEGLTTLVATLRERVAELERVEAHDFQFLGNTLSELPWLRAWEAVRYAVLGSPRATVPAFWLADWLEGRTRTEVLAMLQGAAASLAERPVGPGTPTTVTAALHHLAKALPMRFPKGCTFAGEELEWVLREAGTPKPTRLSTLASLGRYLREQQLSRGVSAWLSCTSREAVLAGLLTAAAR